MGTTRLPQLRDGNSVYIQKALILFKRKDLSRCFSNVSF